MLLAALSRLLPRPPWSDFFVTPATQLRWHPYPDRPHVDLSAETSRPPLHQGRRPRRGAALARENPTWGYQRISGELAGPGSGYRPVRYATSSTEPAWPAPRRDGPTWGQFLKAQAARVWAGDNHDGLPACRYRDLLDHLSTLDRQAVIFAGRQIEKLTSLTPVQRRAFELLGTPVPSPSSSQYNKAARTRHGCSSQVSALTTSPRSSKFG
jgi:hypothetical protein